MAHESFARWQLPRQIDGVVLLEDFSETRGRMGLDQRHHHDELELHLVTRGSGIFLLAGRRVRAAPGTLLFVRPGSDHTLLEADRQFCRWMLLFRPRVVRRVLPPAEAKSLLDRRAASEKALELCRTLTRHATRALVTTYAETRQQLADHMSLYNTGVAYALGRSWSSFVSADAAVSTTPLHPAVAEAVRRLREPAPPASRRELARACGLSEWHLSKLFSAELGVSLVSFRNRCRLERFFELYEDGRRTTLLAAALDAGFGSYAQFHRVFRAHMKYGPRELSARS
jgi:AraC-like DNA-binding protein